MVTTRTPCGNPRTPCLTPGPLEELVNSPASQAGDCGFEPRTVYVALGCNMEETWDYQGTWTNSLSQLVRLPRSATPPAFILRLPKGKSLALGAGVLRNLVVYKGPGFDQGGPPGPGSLPPPPGTVKWMRCNGFARLSSKQKESGSSPGIRT
jgi:hypothetical protein